MLCRTLAKVGSMREPEESRGSSETVFPTVGCDWYRFGFGSWPDVPGADMGEAVLESNCFEFMSGL